MTRLRSLIKEVLSQPKKKDCNCGCNDCGGKAPILTEGKVKHLISEGLQYHMDKKIQLHESVYRIGSEKHFELIREARALWVRGIIDVSEDDQAILETNLGNFGMYEGEEVPLDMPMVNEDYDPDAEQDDEDVPNPVDDEGRPLGESLNEEENDRFAGLDPKAGSTIQGTGFDWKKKMPSQEEVDKFFSITQNEMHYLNSKPVRGQKGDRVRSEIEPWDEYDLSNWNALVRKAKAQGKINEGPIDRVIGGRPYKYVGDGRKGKAIVSGPMKDREKGDIIKRAKKAGYIAKPNMGGGVTIFIESVNEEVDEGEFSDKIIKSVIKPKEVERLSKVLNSNNIPFQTEKLGKVTMFKFKSYDDVDKVEALISRNRIDIDEVDRYSGFNRNPEDPDSEPFEPKGSVAQFKEDLRALFGKFKGDLKNPEFIKGVAEIMVNWKALLRSQLDEKKKAKSKKKDPPIGKPKRGGSKAYYVYVRDPKTKRIKKVSFGSGGLRAKIRNPKARKAFAARHKCSQKTDRTKPSYWSCRLPRYVKQLGLGSNMNTFW